VLTSYGVASRSAQSGQPPPVELHLLAFRRERAVGVVSVLAFGHPPSDAVLLDAARALDGNMKKKPQPQR
jgi:hypothetical protein